MDPHIVAFLSLAGRTLEHLRKFPAMKTTCDNCPFRDGTPLNRSLAPERLDDFKLSVLLGNPFHCHKTRLCNPKTEFVEDPETGFTHEVSWASHYRVCPGSLEWLDEAASLYKQSRRARISEALLWSMHPNASPAELTEAIVNMNDQLLSRGE